MTQIFGITNGQLVQARQEAIAQSYAWTDHRFGQLVNQMIANKPYSLVAYGNTDIMTSSTAFADMLDMSITFNLANVSTLLLMWSGRIRFFNNSACRLQFLVDGVAKHCQGSGNYMTDREGSDMACVHWVEQGVSPGTHTVKLQWRMSVAAAYQDGLTFPRLLSVIVIP